MLSQLQTRSGFAGFKPRAAAPRAVTVAVRASAVAQPATLPVKSTEGADLGSEQLALKVAQETAKGLVHRYLVYVQQNARRVRIIMIHCCSNGVFAIHSHLQFLQFSSRALPPA
jgi:hypothetical protein